MNIDLAALLLKVIAWAEGQAAIALTAGTPLAAAGIDAAQSVGAQHPEDVRIVVVDRIPWPDDPALRDAALQT
jgi:hypothetical protein